MKVFLADNAIYFENRAITQSV